MTRRLYVANTGEDTVSIINLKEGREAHRVQLRAIGGLLGEGAAGPLRLVHEPGGRFVYCANAYDDSVSVIDSSDRQADAGIPVGAQPVALEISPDGRWLYVCCADSNNIALVDCALRRMELSQPAGNWPRHIAHCGADLVVASAGSNDLYRIDRNDFRLRSVLSLEEGYPQASAYHPATRSLLASLDTGLEKGRLCFIDADSDRVTDCVAAGVMPSGLCVSPRGYFALIADAGAGEVLLMDLEANKIARRIPVGGMPDDILLDEKRGVAYVSGTQRGAVSVVDLTQMALCGRIATGQDPSGMTAI